MSAKKRLLLAQDCSGSTSGNDKYFDAVSFLYFSSKQNYTDILLWSNLSMYITSEKYEQLLQSRKGKGTTNPHVIIQWMIENNFQGDVVLITDGQIPVKSVQHLDQVLAESVGKFKITHIKCVLIQTITSKIDTTVIAPFIRRYPNEVILYGREDSPIKVTTGSQTQEELIQTLQSINTIQQFQDKSSSIFTNVVTKMMGKPINIEIRDEILKLQKRLMFQLRIPPPNFFIKDLLDAFQNHDQKKMIELSEELNRAYISENQNITWPSLIFHLLRMTSGSLNNVYSIHALGTAFQADRIRRADVIEHFEAAEAESTSGEADFICPITYEEESDVVLLIKKPKLPILWGLEKDFANIVITCPFSGFNSIEFTNLLIQNIDQPISLTSMKGAHDSGHPIVKSPLTRSPILGGLCLGAADDHVKATNWVLSRLMSGGKNVGIMDQWFALIWYLVEKNRIPYLNPILPKIRQHMIYRLQKHLGTASLTKIPYLCQTSLPSGICYWFALHNYSQRLIKLDPLNIFIYIQICELAGYEIEEDYKRKLMIQAAEKAIQKIGEDQLPNIYKLCYATIDKYPSIFVDGPVNMQNRNNVLKKLPITWADIPINILRIAVNHVLGGNAEEDIEDVNWGYGLNPYNMPHIQICPATFRPYLLVPPYLHSWKVVAHTAFKTDKQLINCHAQYIKYVLKYEKFPNDVELADFCFKSIVPKKNVTLPCQIEQFMDCVMKSYDEVIKEKTPAHFIKVTNKSLFIRNRSEIECRYHNSIGITVYIEKYQEFMNNKTHKK